MSDQAPGRSRPYLDRFRVTGRRALVTGGGRGIGLACAEALAEAGAEVVIVDNDEANAAEGLEALRAKGFAARSIVLDITDAPRVAAVADELAGRGEAIDILVCNAGIARSGTPAEDVADEHWRNVIDVNLKSYGRKLVTV